MTHEEALNLILAQSCHNGPDENDVRTFHITLHCVEMQVKAKLASTVDTIQYEIVDVTFT